MRRLTTPGATVIVSGILIALFLVVQGCTTPHPPPVVTVTVSTDGCKEGAASTGSEVLSIGVEMESGSDLLPDDVRALDSIHIRRAGIHGRQQLGRVQPSEGPLRDL